MDCALTSETSGKCATCRYISPKLERYTATPWDVSFSCVVRGSPLAPHAGECARYEREAGAD